MVETYALAKQSVEVVASHGSLAGRECGSIAEGESGGDVAGDLFGGPAAGGKDQDRAKVGQDGAYHGPGDVALDAGRLAGLQGVQRDFLEGDGAGVLFDEGHLTAEATEPFRDGLRVGDAAAEQEELGGGWGDG